VIGRIVEIAEDNRHLRLFRGFLVVEQWGQQREEVGRVPLDDIAAVIAHGHGLSYSNNLLVALAEQGAPFVLCGANHAPVGILWSTNGQHEQSRRMEAQVDCRRPLKKQLWARLVRAKLLAQAATLQSAGKSASPLLRLAGRVRSGDTGNLEAQGAAAYWRLLFGDEFRRDRDAAGINVLLNYGYTVLRACVARSVLAAGLHPGIGLHHSHDQNAMRLVDDLIEPFRPSIDLRVWQLAQDGVLELDRHVKRELVHCLYADLQTSAGTTPLMVCTQRLATSLALVLLGSRQQLDLPVREAVAIDRLVAA
jgi:CRISPR-associated protein Cas1